MDILQFKFNIGVIQELLMEYSIIVKSLVIWSEPLSWVVCEYGVDGVSTDSSLLHLGHYVLQQVPVPMTSIASQLVLTHHIM